VQRQFTVVRASQVWVTDITYIRTWQGWLYLAVVIDLFARNVVGWSMKPTYAVAGCADDGRLASKTGQRGHRTLGQ
jgi:putative transposase